MSGGSNIPNGQQMFIDGNGAPYAGGSVYMYVVGTTTPLNTYVDQPLTTPNANPVVLDSAGRCTMYGTGLYRQILKDSLGNTIWDKVVGFPMVVGQLLNIQYFTTAGTFTYTPTAGTNQVVVEVVGGGGGGGGATTTGASTNSSGGGGGGGGYARKRITSNFSGAPITVGAGGAGVNNAAGGNGGTSSFGSLVSATGGAPGQLGGASVGGGSAVGGQGGIGSSGDINARGEQGGFASFDAAVACVSGPGGGSYFGGGGYLATSGTGAAGNAATSIGGGGSGACNAQNQAGTLSGGNGFAGAVIVWEYS